MADTSTTVYGFVQPEVGASRNTWGTKLNNNFGEIDDNLSRVDGQLTSVAGTDTITATLTGVDLTGGLALGDQFSFVPAANNTGATTLNVNSTGAVSIIHNGASLGANALVSGVPVMVRFDGTNYELLARGDSASLNAASQTFAGNVSINGNTTLGDAAGDTVTFNAQTWSAPNGFVVNTTDLVFSTYFTTGKFFKASNTAVYGNAAGLGDVSTNASHNFQSDQNNSTLAAISSSTGGTVANYDSHLPTGAAGFHFQGNVNTSATIRILANGDLQNTNNSYGALSDRKLKNLLQKKYGADYYERFKQIQFWTYTLINDPKNQALLGVVAQELQDIFPGLVESTAEMHEVKKSRAVIKKVQRTRTEQQSKTNRTIEEVDGRWTLIETNETVEVEVPVFEEHQVFDQDGKLVMQIVKAGVSEILDADGNILQASFKPVYEPLIHRVAVIDEIEEQQEYTESVQKINPETGDPEITLSVKYSILYQIAAMVTQELQFRNDEHSAQIADQAIEIMLLTARIEKLEAK
jgi:hypothetical protein